jgi:hypothetical protein
MKSNWNVIGLQYSIIAPTLLVACQANMLSVFKKKIQMKDIELVQVSHAAIWTTKRGRTCPKK